MLARVNVYLCAFALTLGLSAPVAAEVRVHEDADVSLFVPDGWTKESSTDQLLVAHEPEVAVLVNVLPARALTETVAGLEVALSAYTGGTPFTAEPRDVHGMKALFARFQGTLAGASVEMSVMVVATSTAHSLLFVAMQKGHDENDLRGIDQMLASIEHRK